jgi:transcriptional antiterminator NusG
MDNTADLKVQEEKPAKINKNHKWFIISTYSGHEKKVANQIKQRVKANDLEEKVSDVVVPTQEKIVVSSGKKKTIEERIFPGYVLICMEMNDDTWQIVRNTEGVTSFIGTEKKPTPLNEHEASSILAYMDVKQPAYQFAFSVGDAVKVVDGPFADFIGTISEINEDRGQVTVLLSVFGRETPVSLDFIKVSKL